MNKSVEQRHAIQKGHRPTAQMEYQGIIWVIKADADKRIAELEERLKEATELIYEAISYFPNRSGLDQNWLEKKRLFIEVSEGGESV